VGINSTIGGFVDPRFIIPNIQTEEQQKVLKDLGVIANVLGIPVITVLQKEPRFKSCQGVKVCNFRKKSDAPTKPGEAAADQYKISIEGGILNFIPNPYGPGNCVFLIDDKELVPSGSKSGATLGYNRDFLASHYGEGLFTIDDKKIDAEVFSRYQNILKRLREEKPMQDARTARVREISTLEENKRKGIQSIAIVGGQSMAISKTEPGPIRADEMPPLPVVDPEKEAMRKEIEELRKKVALHDGEPGPGPTKETDYRDNILRDDPSLSEKGKTEESNLQDQKPGPELLKKKPGPKKGSKKENNGGFAS